MQTSYKFWYITRDDDGYITECAIRFYEGETSKKLEYVDIDRQEEVTRYRRVKRLNRADLSHFSVFKKEANGNDTVVFNQSDFGSIKTDQELIAFLNVQLAKDGSRTPINEQKA